jgi:protocatechuate 3,4-dioxygenase beta subunit
MKLADNIKKLIRDMHVLDINTSDEMDRRIVHDALKAQEKLKETTSAETQPNTWRIIMQSKMTKFAAAAAMMGIAVLIGISFFNGTSAWAKVIQAFNEVENVHIIQKMITPDGTVQQNEIWLRRPNCLYQDTDNRIVIDNGQERLTIDKENKTAQFSDSLMSFKPLDKHFMFDVVNLFRGQGRMDVEIAKLDGQSDEATLVFSLSHEDEASDFDWRGKAWVDAATMLPKEMQVEPTSEPKEGSPKRIEAFFDYGPIPDDVFAMTVPEGFSELARKVRGVMSGVVLDEQEQPVANAIVYATDRIGRYIEQTVTDESGRFTFDLPPEGAGLALALPVLFRAFVQDVPDKVAWSIIADPANRHGPGSGWEPGGNIPYDVANVENDRNILKSANGITLRMEPAGAISGQVTDADGNPISDAKVQLLKCALSDKHGTAGLWGIDVDKWSGSDELGIVRTDENGLYELTNLPKLWKRTKVTVHAIAEGFAGDTTSFRLQGPMEHQKVDFQLYQNSLTVTGTLIDNYGKPIEEAPIYAMVNGKRFYSVKTNKRGAFKIKGCPDTSDLQIEAELSRNSRSPYEKEKYESYIYYPDVITGIDYQQDKLEYEIEMMAELPEFTLNVEARNTAGEPVKFFPVQIRGDGGPVRMQWQIAMDLIRRTDENGRCTFTNVPNIPGLKVVLCRVKRTWKEKLTDSEKVIAEESMEKYLWGEVSVEIVEGQKEYDLTVVVFKLGEERDQKKSQK